jgi:hypothetical protein
MLTVLGLICASAAIPASISSAQPIEVSSSTSSTSTPTASVGQVVQWNRTLLSIIRTPGAQPATIHSTRSFAIMHAAIFDAVNAIDRKHRAYAIVLNDISRFASKDAAVAAAAHAVLVALYPAKQSELDSALQQSLASIADDARKTEGIRAGETVAARLLELRSHDGSDRQPPVYVFGTSPGDYQSTPPNFPPQPGFTHWAGVRPFVLEHAARFRPGPPPALTGRRYARALNEVREIGAAGGTIATSDQIAFRADTIPPRAEPVQCRSKKSSCRIWKQPSPTHGGSPGMIRRPRTSCRTRAFARCVISRRCAMTTRARGCSGSSATRGTASWLAGPVSRR